MRKLASIQVIKSLEPIEGADVIERAQVLGWGVVVKKGDFKVGDMVIYCEIDSVMPKRDEFSFLANARYRIKTIRLRGQISQGICFPLSILGEGIPHEEDLDVTEHLGVIKYEPVIPACLNGIQEGAFPSHIPKTDETRVQTLPRMLKQYAGTPAYISLKLDGSSATYCIKDGKFIVASRGMSITENDKNSFWIVARRDNIEEKLRNMSESLGREVSMQGELVGPSIQKNLLGLKQHEVYFFNFFMNDEHAFLGGKALSSLCDEYGLKMVPVLDWNHIIHDDIDAYINKYNGMSHAMYQNKQIEGVVIRPLQEVHDRYHGRISFKVINNKFLLKHED